MPRAPGAADAGGLDWISLTSFTWKHLPGAWKWRPQSWFPRTVPPPALLPPWGLVVFSLVSADTQGSPAGTSREDRSGCGKDPLLEALTGRPGLRVLMALDSAREKHFENLSLGGVV